MTTLEPLMERNFLEYASYVIVDRAIPDLRDGFKPVQRRILHTLFEMDDGKFHKVANVIGETMKLHPHGDASIGDALVVLANKDYFIDKQGNFGNPVTGHAAAAARYIECRLTELARETLFNPALTEMQPSYDRRKQEPTCLPVKLPVVLLTGTEGIAVGMATKILPHNLDELLAAQIAILEHRPFALYPDFAEGGIVDVGEYDDGRGKVRVRARLEATDEKTVVIREIPFSTTTESLIASIEAAVQKGKLKVATINDFTTDQVEIELTLSRGVYADEVIPQLYAYTDCEVSISSNIVVIKDRHPIEASVSELLHLITDRLRDQLGAELAYQLEELRQKQHWLTLERIFIEHRVYKRIEDARSEEAVRAEVFEGMQPYAKTFVRPMTEADVDKLLELRIRRISQFDIDRNRRELTDVKKRIAETEDRLAHLTRTTIDWLEQLRAKYGPLHPRRTEIRAIDAVDRKAVARQTIKLSYDPESGFFGSEVKGAEHQLTVSEYDRILALFDDGSFRIMSPPEKTLFPGKPRHLSLFDEAVGQQFTVVYRDKQRHVFGKRVHIQRYIRDKEYELIKDRAGKIDLLLPGDARGTLQLTFVPQKRQKILEAVVDLAEIEAMGVTARGKHLTTKPVSKIRYVADRSAPPSVPPSTSGDDLDTQAHLSRPPRPAPPPTAAPTIAPGGKPRQRTLFDED